MLARGAADATRAAIALVRCTTAAANMNDESGKVRACGVGGAVSMCCIRIGICGGFMVLIVWPRSDKDTSRDPYHLSISQIVLERPFLVKLVDLVQISMLIVL